MTTTNLDHLVDSWLTVTDVAEQLGVPLAKVRRLLEERRIVGIRRGEPPVVSVPERFLVPGHLANPAQPGTAGDGAEWTVLAALHGTFTVLADVGFDDEAAIAWLFTPADALGATPLDALLGGRKAEVRRLAATEL